jgi:asparagine synthase (glutamine-hydrolysing)
MTMCGILGFYDPAGIAPESTSFAAALERLKRRGPDDSGTWHDAYVRLGHRRLAIVDLSAAGHQPMESSDRRFIIVFNGEIYGHRELRARLSPRHGWAGASDTETLVEAYRTWGPDCLKYINGMFAFAIWDRTEHTLFLARDRMGVKPLYYAQRNGTFAFASRPGALTQLLSQNAFDINAEALRIYLELGYIPAPLAFHDGMHKLAPGHYMLVHERGSRIVRYWDFRSIAPDLELRRRPEGQLEEELDALIRDAVKIRLMSDVPLGAFLSGGVDSALVVAAMKSAGVEHPRTFTIAFKEQAFDEGPAAAQTARHLGVDHVHETLDVDSLLELLPTYIDEYDEPFADSSAFPTMAVARLARRHVTVALSGDGADELFGGYHYYPLMNKLQATTRWRKPVKRLIGRLVSSMPAHRAKLFAGAVQCDDTVALFNYLRSVGKDYPALVDDGILRSTSSSDDWFAQFAAGFAVDLSGAETGMRLDAGFTLPELFLQKVDVATMAFSLEARCPMTDYRLVEWAMRLPLEYKLRGGETKYLLKKVLCKYLPPNQVYRKKMGFGVPIAAWLRGPLRDWARELIHDDTLMAKMPLDRAKVRDLLNKQMSGERESHPLLWSVLMLLCFVQKHHAGQSLPAISYRAVA